MIATLHIKNIGIIDDIMIDLSSGFNVLTGETGAGKTLIIDSLNLVCGGRFSKEILRHGESSCLVELNIFMPDSDICKSINSDGEIIVSREIFISGRNNCKINGRLVSVNELKDFMKEIIDIHGQNDNQKIMLKSEHLQYLDNFIGIEIEKIKEQYTDYFFRYNEIISDLKLNYGDEKEKQRRLDLLNYQFNEIEEANLKIGEEEELEGQKRKITNAEKIYTSLNEIDDNLSNNVIDGINNSIKCFEKIESIDGEYSEKLGLLKNIYYDIQELARDVSRMNNSVEFSEEDRESIEERLYLIQDLKRKYGNNVEEIIKYKDDIKDEIYNIENLEDQNNKLKQELADIKIKMEQLSQKLNEIRTRNADVLSKRINQELKDLEMPGAKFSVKIVYDEQLCFNRNGLDDIEFMISTNVGDEAKSLIKIASGGEISRIMLAIKTVLADTDKVPVLVFDEIDTGISGKAAKSVGDKIKIISNNHQVLCITHQANIAAKGDSNFYISKKVESGKTYTNVKLLNEDEVIKEIARISSGDLTENAINHAKEMRYLAS